MADKTVQMPDGSVIAFPDTMSDDQISAALRTYTAPTAQGLPAGAHPAGLPANVALPGLPSAPPPPNMPQASPGLLGLAKDNFNAGTQHAAPPTSLLDMFSPTRALQNFGASAGDSIRAVAHVFDKQQPLTLDQQYDRAGQQVDAFSQDPVAAYVNAAGGAAPGLIVGAGVHDAAPALKAVGSAVKDAAIGDTDAAALRGLQVPAGSNKVQGILRAVGTARPWLSGVQTLEDLQARVPAAKQEIWAPYQSVIDKYGDTPVMGPDGATTLGGLEEQRSQLSALNRALKSREPDAVQLAQQKGLSQADLLQQEADVKAALDPVLSDFGLNPKAIRSNFAAVDKVGKQVAGKSTIIEPTQPYGFAKVPTAGFAKGLDLANPATYPRVVSGLWNTGRDVVAGRTWFDSPTDVGIREGFRGNTTKPALTGAPTQTGLDMWQSNGAAKMAEHLGTDKTSGLNVHDINTLGNTPQGRQMLINAGDLKPGTKAMANLAQQMNAFLNR